ncbi:MAG TPA: hypothetical protein GX725_02960, partial [Mollicutes bacterium]|nr:hypothetical protein [Mollicutes bacterium]
KIKKLIIYGSIITLLYPKSRIISNYKIYNDSFYNKIKSSKEIENDGFNIIAHRGFSSLVIENSWEAINICNDYKSIDGIEIDISMTKDKRIVILHTNQYGYNFNLNKPVSEYTLNELKNKRFKVDTNYIIKNILFLSKKDKMNDVVKKRSLNLFRKWTTIITLDELLSNYNFNKQMIIDVKFHSNNNAMIDELFNQLSKIDCTNIIIQSTDYDSLKTMKNINPNLKYQLVISNTNQLKHLDSEINMFAIKASLLDYETIEKLIKNDKSVAVWTINNEHNLNKIINNIGIYWDDVAYITDYPDYISTLLNEKGNVKTK